MANVGWPEAATEDITCIPIASHNRFSSHAIIPQCRRRHFSRFLSSTIYRETATVLSIWMARPIRSCIHDSVEHTGALCIRCWSPL